MLCALRCGGCRIDGTEESERAFLEAMDKPLPAECPQVAFMVGASMQEQGHDVQNRQDSHGQR